MSEECNPTFAKVDAVLDLLTKSKSLHILLVLDQKDSPLRFSQIKSAVNSSSTTVSRRLKELEDDALIIRINLDDDNKIAYTLSEDGKLLSPIMKSLFDWSDNR
jgi:DNA-binding HxlR family transcriptional regulator